MQVGKRDGTLKDAEYKHLHASDHLFWEMICIPGGFSEISLTLNPALHCSCFAESF